MIGWQECEEELVLILYCWEYKWILFSNSMEKNDGDFENNNNNN